MALTTLEKSQLRKMICAKGATEEILSEYADKTDEYIRAELLVWKPIQITKLDTQKSVMQSRITRMTIDKSAIEEEITQLQEE